MRDRVGKKVREELRQAAVVCRKVEGNTFLCPLIRQACADLGDGKCGLNLPTPTDDLLW